MMDLILIYTPFIISLLIGFFCVQLLLKEHTETSFLTSLFLGGGLGLGISASLTFLSFIFFNQLVIPFVLILHIVIFGILLTLATRRYVMHKEPFVKLTDMHIKHTWPLFLFLFLSIPIWFQCNFYIHGGWDAWATWNTKAKFLFLAGKDWQEIFSPVLWRSSPHYPIFLPLMNVWGWIWTGTPTPKIPMITSYLFTFYTAGLLYAVLKRLTHSYLALLPAIVLLTLRFFVKIASSQYCDMLLSFYLLAAISSLLTGKKENNYAHLLLCGIFLGFLSFSKNEGLLAGLIIIALSIPYFFWGKTFKEAKSNLIYLFGGCMVSFILPVIFYKCYAPENVTFINGLDSPTNSSDWWRLKTIFGFYLLDVGAPLWNIFVLIKQDPEFTYLLPKWAGLWVLITIGFFVKIRSHCSKLTLIIPIFLFLYTLTFTAYYFVNTQWEIKWWLQISFHRILSTLLPTCLFWSFFSVWNDDKITNNQNSITKK